jgi:hypothetical protein
MPLRESCLGFGDRDGWSSGEEVLRGSGDRETSVSLQALRGSTRPVTMRCRDTHSKPSVMSASSLCPGGQIDGWDLFLTLHFGADDEALR